MNGITESRHRLYEKLLNDLGDAIIAFLYDKDINEIMLNPDGKLWIDSSTKGLLKMSTLSKQDAFSIIHSIAGIHNFVVNQYNPQLEAELPTFKAMNGERFTAQVPPIVSSPSFTIRKKPEIIFTLEDYVTTNRITTNQAEKLRDLVCKRKNILVCGGPGSGKTTVTNALIVEAIKIYPNQRILILEDLPELQCNAINKVTFLTTNTVTMTDLLRTAMRMRPDRILIGEVRGKEALDMLKAWNTGCPGGICTVHANGAVEAIQRILDLAMEAGLTTIPISLVQQTIDVVISVRRKGSMKGFIEEILELENIKDEKFTFKKLA